MVPKIQAVKVENTKKVRLSMEIEDFSFFQLCQFVFLEPLGVQRRYVPHFKAPISGNLDFEAQGRDSTFTFLHTQKKLYKRAKGM